MLSILTILFLYLYAFLVGLSWTAIPALGTVLTSASCNHLSSAQYGTLSMAVMISAIISSNLCSTLLLRFGMRKNFLNSVLLIIGANLLLFSTRYSTHFYLSGYFLLLSSQLLLGFGIGMALTSLNVYIASLLKKYSAGSIVAMYASMGLGSSYAPIYFETILPACNWHIKPLAIAIIIACVFYVFLKILPTIQPNVKTFQWKKVNNYRFWLFALLPLMYGMIEDAFSVWGPVGLFKEGWSSLVVDQGLSYFWGTLTITQLIISFFSFKYSPKWIYFFQPIVILLAFILFAEGTHFTNKPWIFALAGAGCSAFFSLTVHFGEQQFSKIMEIVSGTFVGGYMIGSGLSALMIGIVRQYLQLPFSSIYFSFIGIAFLMWVISIYLVQKAR